MDGTSNRYLPRLPTFNVVFCIVSMICFLHGVHKDDKQGVREQSIEGTNEDEIIYADDTNCIAQGAALMTGRASEDGARNYPGDRPSTTILLDQVTPHALGALIAFYEHRVFANAVLLGINPFDQFGVELGKEMAKGLAEGTVEFDPATQALMAAALGE